MPSPDFCETFERLPGTPAPLVSRLPELVGYEGALDSALRTLKIAIVGTGSVGMNIASHVSQMHPAAMYFIDSGRFKAESVLTHMISLELIGAPKAATAARLAKQVSPNSRVFFSDGPVESLSAVAFAGLDVLFLAADNVDAELEVGQRCLHHRVPLIQASVHGATLVAQVRCFANTDGRGPCPGCGFNSAERALLGTNTKFSCAGYYGDTQVSRQGPKTESFSFLCAIAADLAMIQMLRQVAEIGKRTHDRMTQYCGYTDEVTVTPLLPNTDCACDHRAMARRTAPRPLGQCTPSDLVRQAALSTEEVQATVLGVDGFSYVESGVCGNCDHFQSVRRFVSSARGVGPCTKCGEPIDADPYYTYRAVPVSRLKGLSDRPFHKLADAAPTSVVLSGKDALLLFENPRNGNPS